MVERSIQDLQSIRAGVARIGKLSDGLVKLGGLRLGLDGVLAWIPGVGELYSTGAGAYILIQGLRAGVPMTTLASAGALLFGRTLITAVPLAGPLAADFLTAHRWASKLVVQAIDEKLAKLGAPMAEQPRGWRVWSGRRPRPPVWAA